MQRLLISSGIVILSLCSFIQIAKADSDVDRALDASRNITIQFDNSQNGNRLDPNIVREYRNVSGKLFNACMDGNASACSQYNELYAAYSRYYYSVRN